MSTKLPLLIVLFLPFLTLAETGPAVPDYPVDKITDTVYVIHGPLETPNPENQGFMNNPGFVLTSKGVVIVDPGASLQSGEMVLKMLKTLTEDPVVAVFNTHIHGDHWLGNQAIKAAYPDVVIYGHPNMITLIENGEGQSWVEMMLQLTDGKTEGTVVVPPTQTIDNGDTFSVGDTSFRVYHYGKAHTTSDIMIEVVEPSVMFLGDNVLNRRIPRIDEGNIQGNIEACTKSAASGTSVFVPGHGRSGDSAMVKQFCDYLTILYTTVKQYYDDGLSDFEMKPQVAEALKAYAAWSGFDQQLGKHISLAYLQIEEADF